MTPIKDRAAACVVGSRSADHLIPVERPMRLFFLIYTLAATALAGVGVTAVLAARLPGWEPIVIAGAIGVLVALPATWIATKKIASL